MNITHAIRRFFSLHPMRRETDAEPSYRSTAEVVAAIRKDYYGLLRRHDDVIGRQRAKFEDACKAAEREAAAKLDSMQLNLF